MPKISVIIATMNRADALKEISLPSLAEQDFKDFEVIIWDASDDDSSKKVVEGFKKKHLDMDVKYFKAPRKGLASQRNDAVKVANGDIVFFIDDDSEVSKDGLEALHKEFSLNKDVYGVGLRLKPSSNKFFTRSMKVNIREFYNCFFRLSNSISSKRKVYLSGWAAMPREDKSGKAEWLSGGSVAYKRTIFSDFFFQEELERFGGYALGEDVYFSHLLLRNGFSLMISSEGHVIHHAVGGGRLENEKKVAARFYNQYLIWRNVIFPRKKLSYFVYLWSLIGEIIFYGLTGLHPRKRERLRGMKMGIKSILKKKGTT